ncbi:MAG: hypothetical protein EAZ12_00315 [Sphingobacteriia bacterium]|nr:MAG: hypothetical protein EAZ12_00315 [Sphingobacteriia bacterium]
MKKVIIAAAALILSFNSFANASVKRDERNSEKVYYKQGEIIGTSTNFDFDKLPKDAIYVITSKYTFPTYSLKECIEFTDVYGEKKYFISMFSVKESIYLEITTDGEVSIASRIRK